MSANRFTFNEQLWKLGNQIENEIHPHLEEYLNVKLDRTDNLYEIMDFHSPDKKVFVEIKGRRVSSKRYETTLLTCNKVLEAEKLKANDPEVKVFIFFCFTDKTMFIELPEERPDWLMRYTGTHSIPHFLIPVSDLKEFEGVEIKSNQDI